MAIGKDSQIDDVNDKSSKFRLERPLGGVICRTHLTPSNPSELLEII